MVDKKDKDQKNKKDNKPVKKESSEKKVTVVKKPVSKLVKKEDLKPAQPQQKKFEAPVREPKSQDKKQANTTPGFDAQGRVYATGRRKTSSARVWIKSGSGKIIINGKDFTAYFPRPSHQMILAQPLEATKKRSQVDVTATVSGGGLSGQAGAVLHGLSRALDKYDNSQHKILRQGGFLTRDSRTVERKKFGRKKARRSFQFSKR